jgi:integrase
MAREAKSKRQRAGGSFTVVGRNSNGSGSIYPVGEGGFRATYRLAWEGGKVRSVRGRTKSEADARRRAAIAAAEAGRGTPSAFGATTTVGELVEWWAEQAAGQVRAASAAKYRERATRVAVSSIGTIQARELRPEQVSRWQSDMLSTLSPSTVSDLRSALRQAYALAVAYGFVASTPVDVVKAPKVPDTKARALDPGEVHALVEAASGHRLGAAVALLFLQGWRVSEVLGLAWSDLDLDIERPTALVRRASAYVDGQGQRLGPTKTSGALGRHYLAPSVVELLRRRRTDQVEERLAAGPAWLGQRYEGAPVDLVFTTRLGGLVLRQAVTKAVIECARVAGLDPSGLGTHAGRRSVVTALYVNGTPIDDVARHVGHSSPLTTAGYVRSLGNRPADTAQRAAQLLDPVAARPLTVVLRKT